MKPQLVGYNAVGEPLRVADKERRFHHHIIGSSGGGKSKFLECLMRENLRTGQGFCLIDPHGTLYEDIVKYCAYHIFPQDIILLNLSEPNHIVGFNFFSKNSQGDVSVQVDSRISATLHAWGVENADQTPTLERVLRLVFTTLLDADLTLPQVAILLDYSQKARRDQIIAKIKNELVRREWQELSDLPKAREFRDEVLSAKNRLFRLLTSKVLMQFLGLPGKTIDLFDAMNSGKTILVNLARSEHLSAENGRLFGSLLVNQFFEAATRRKKDAAGNDPRPYYLYLDEFQNFVSLDLCSMLDEVRKFGLFLTLSHQRFGQLNEEIEDAILANCRTKTVFGGLRVEDARRMAEELFIGNIDPMKIKAAIYQTKHWYKYTREKVFTKSKSYGESESESEGTGHSRGSGDQSSFVSGSNSSTGSSYQMEGIGGQVLMPPTADGGVYTGAMWLSESASQSQVQSSGFSEMESDSEFSGSGSSRSWSESEGVADIPVFVPVPYQELSSVQYYTPEEQLLELTQALKLQQQRHCFIQLPNQETQPLLVPFVETFTLSKKNYNWFINWIAQKNNAITPEEADNIIFQAQQDLLQSKDQPASAKQLSEDESAITKDKINKDKSNAFTNIPTEDDDPFGRE